jgi:sucrose-6-phosphate hydrolase SacC (GH32 family)
VIAIGSSGQSDFRIREIGNVLYDPSDVSAPYKTTYTGYSTGTYPSDEKIHYAYSLDGTTWSKYGSNPVISNRRAEDPYVLKVGSTYYLYAEDKEAGGEDKIRRWSSSDFTSWSDDGQITGVSDAQSPVVWMEGSTWYMLYEHYPTDPEDIRLATSSDGLAWTNEATNPVMSASDTAWADTTIVPDDIYKLEGVYYMTYHGFVTGEGTFKAGIAKSSDLLTWVDLKSPIIPLSAATPSVTMSFIDDGIALGFLYYGNTDSTGIYKGYIFG